MPLTCESFCCRMVSAASYSCPGVRVFEVSARISMGASAVLTLW